MSRLVWDKTGERFYETGVKNGVLYLLNYNGTYGRGVVWNGITAVNVTPEGAEATDIYADDIKYASFRSVEKLNATIECFQYPVEFNACEGHGQAIPGLSLGQQARRSFGFCYKTSIGSDMDTSPGSDYKLHIIYNALCLPSEKAYQTTNDSPDAVTHSFELSTTPVKTGEYRPVSYIVIDSRKVSREKLARIEELLYGTELTDAQLPNPYSVIFFGKKIDLEEEIANAIADSFMNEWVWDTFNFRKDNIRTASARAAQSHIYYDVVDLENATLPAIVYTLTSGVPSEDTTILPYTVTVIESDDESDIQDQIETVEGMTFVEDTTADDIYYHTYHIDY